MPVGWDPEGHECDLPEGAAPGTVWWCDGCRRWWTCRGEGTWRRRLSPQARIAVAVLVAMALALVLLALVE